MAENLNTNDIKIFEKISNDIKEIQSNSENEFNLFHKEIIESMKKENITTDLDQEKILEINKELFNSKIANKISEINNSLFSDIDDKFLAAYKAILSNLPGVGPLFSVAFSIFSSGPNLAQVFEEILKRVEAIVKKAVDSEARRNCLIKFQNLQTAGANHKDLTTKWFDANGIKSHSYTGQEIKSDSPSTLVSSPELEEMIRSSYLDFKLELEKAINHFSEPTYFGQTITLYIYTIVMYSSFLRDTITWGKQMNFPSEIIDGTANTPSLKQVHNSFLKGTGSKLNQGFTKYTNMINATMEGSWFQPPGMPGYMPPPIWVPPTQYSWLNPPGSSVGKLLALGNSDDYPNGVTTVKANSSKVFELEPRKGYFSINIVEYDSDLLGYSRSTYPSFRFGTDSLVTSYLLIFPIVFTIENKNNFNRNVAINVNHSIGREGTWLLNCFNVAPGEPGSIMKSYNFTSYDVSINPQQTNTSSAGVNKLGVFSINHKYITLTCVRSYANGASKGYSYGSNIYSIDIIEQ